MFNLDKFKLDVSKLKYKFNFEYKFRLSKIIFYS